MRFARPSIALGLVIGQVCLTGCSLFLDSGERAPTSGPDASPGTPTCVDFEDLDVPFRMVLGSYAGIDFGNRWEAYEEGAFGSQSVAIAFRIDTDAASFDLEEGPRVLTSVRMNGSVGPITLTLSDGVNPPFAALVDEPMTYATGWTQPASRITVSSDNGFRFFIDELCFDGALLSGVQGGAD